MNSPRTDLPFTGEGEVPAIPDQTQSQALLHPTIENEEIATTPPGVTQVSGTPTQSCHSPAEGHVRLEDQLAERISEAITYTTECHRTGTLPAVYMDFDVPSTLAPTTLALLRKAQADGIATLICVPKPKKKTDDEGGLVERYSLGVPRYEQMNAYNFNNQGPQWWLGLSEVEIRAGPGADCAKLKEAERRISAVQKSSGRQRRLKAERHNFKEGLRRQWRRRGLSTSDISESGVKREREGSDSSYGADYVGPLEEEMESEIVTRARKRVAPDR